MNRPTPSKVFCQVNFHIIHILSSTVSPHSKTTTTMTKTSVQEVQRRPWRRTFVLQMNSCIRKVFQTLLSWQHGVPVIIFWFNNPAEKLSRRDLFVLLYANIIKRTETTEGRRWIVAPVVPLSRFVQTPLLSFVFLTTLTSINSPACLFSLHLSRRTFVFHLFYQVLLKKSHQVTITVMVITWPVLLARWN